MKRMLIFEESPEKRKTLTRLLRVCLDRIGIRNVKFLYFCPQDVFSRSMPESALAAFFSVENMYDAEAARKLSGLRKGIPLAIVSADEEYTLEAWAFSTTRYYLVWPPSQNNAARALNRCLIGLNQ